MPKTVVGILTLFFLSLASSPALPQLKKIRFSTTSIAVTELQFRIAHLKGFYREEGLDLETLLIRGSVGMQALIGGSVDYASAAGSIIAAAVRGVPVRLVLIVNAKPQFDLVGRPDSKIGPAAQRQDRRHLLPWRSGGSANTTHPHPPRCHAE